ncbi:MAG: SRPBCC domain-containing protein [Pseudomonadota bacterium]
MSKLKVTTPTDTTIRFERALGASPDRVFHAFTDAGLMAQWYSDPSNPIVSVESEPREGGAYKMVWDGSDGAMTMSGIYTLFDRPNALKSTEHWDPDWAGGKVLNDIEFHSRGDGTNMILTSTYASKEARDGAKDGAAEGFGACLDAMDALFASATA